MEATYIVLNFSYSTALQSTGIKRQVFDINMDRRIRLG
jgi:hypothetical protein